MCGRIIKVIPRIVGSRIPDLTDYVDKEKKPNLYGLVFLLLFKQFKNKPGIIEMRNSFHMAFEDFLNERLILVRKEAKSSQNYARILRK